ncbi:MAG: DsbA family protein [Alphaproteobacteria bacterium]|nr:DsbA family protein [Alphaproteobacteria bacterium]MDE1931389.1 DsbA family protein [Alphaproteobacteria bacterium]
MRKLAIAVLITLAAAFATPATAAAQSFSPAQQQEIDRLIHDYLQQHPEAVMGALKASQQQADNARAAAAKKVIAAKRDELLHDPNSVVAGNPNGDVTLVEFFDYRCPYCKAIEPSLEALIKEDGKLRVVYKEFPILGPTSVVASRAAIAARQQGKYTAFHDRMMALKGNIDADAVMKVAEASGLDVTKLKHDMAAASVGQIIQRNYTLADALGIDATPALVIGDQLTMGAVDIDGLRQLIADARKNKKGS